MLVHKSYKFEIFPTESQKIQLNKTFGCCRFVYNRALAQCNELYELEKNKEIRRSFRDIFKEVKKIFSPLSKTEEYSWLRDTYMSTSYRALDNLENAFKRFFSNISKYPKFKKKNSKQSLTVLIGHNINFEYLGNILRLPKKLGHYIKIGKGRRPEGKPKTLTINKTPTGRYFVSIICEDVPQAQYAKTGKEVGIDTGIKSLAVLSDGKVYEGVKSLKNNLKKLKYLHRQLSKKDKFYKEECKRLEVLQGESYVKPKRSNRRERAKLALAKLYEKVSNIRSTSLHQITTDIVKNHDCIFVEDLDVKNLIKNKKLSRHLLDNALGTFYRYLEYKCRWHNRIFIKIDRYFPSSKMCGNCKEIKKDLNLSDRDWICRSCGTQHDRDLNASRNILEEGKRILREKSDGAVSGTDYNLKDGEASVPLNRRRRGDKRRVCEPSR